MGFERSRPPPLSTNGSKLSRERFYNLPLPRARGQPDDAKRVWPRRALQREEGWQRVRVIFEERNRATALMRLP